jgi:hypothetical protein
MTTIDALPTGPKAASALKPTWLRSNWDLLLARSCLSAKAMTIETASVIDFQ